MERRYRLEKLTRFFVINYLTFHKFYIETWTLICLTDTFTIWANNRKRQITKKNMIFVLYVQLRRKISAIFNNRVTIGLH